MGLILIPWQQGWKRLEVLTGLSRSRLEKLQRYENLPLLYGPLNEVRMHPISFYRWMNGFPSCRVARARSFLEAFAPDDRWVLEAVAQGQIKGFEQKDGCPVEALWISTWRSIALYCGFRSADTAAKLHYQYGMPCWLIAGRVRSMPAVIDVFFQAWHTIKKGERSAYVKRRQQKAGECHQ